MEVMVTVTSDNYIQHVLRTDSPVSPGPLGRLQDPQTIRLLHAAMGMMTEGAELMDMLKKHIFYGRALDIVNAAEEVGDSLWYSGLAADVVGKTLNEILTMNIEKLRLRYPEKFTEGHAIHRDTDAERVLLEAATTSIRGTNWLRFSAMVLAHIEGYTVPQYGDEGVDQLTEWSCADCIHEVKKYTNRVGKNIRGAEDQHRDFLKMAHYISVALEKFSLTA